MHNQNSQTKDEPNVDNVKDNDADARRKFYNQSQALHEEESKASRNQGLKASNVKTPNKSGSRKVKDTHKTRTDHSSLVRSDNSYEYESETDSSGEDDSDSSSDVDDTQPAIRQEAVSSSENSSKR